MPNDCPGGGNPPDLSACIAELRNCLSRQDFAGAFDAVNRAMLMAPTNPELWICRSDLFRLRGDKDNAYEDLKKAILMAPRFPPAYLALSHFLAETGRSEHAVIMLQKGLSISPGDPAMLELLAVLSRQKRISKIKQRRSTANSAGMPQLIPTRSDHFQEFLQTLALEQTEWARRTDFERTLLTDGQPFVLPGYCYPCQKTSEFEVDYLYSSVRAGLSIPNWRERLVCPHCQLNNRLRASIHLWEHLLEPEPLSSIFIAEQTTPLYAWLHNNYIHVTGSEYLGDSVPFGQKNDQGIRNESLTQLTFGPDLFDFLMIFDVFEHIPDYAKTLRECYRVLKPGGSLFFSVPFHSHAEKNIVRATLTQTGEIQHILPPEYHGDPVKIKGCLCFYTFGWELLDECRGAGFREVAHYSYWSREFGYLGALNGLPMILVARK
jgi:SAM-dependent methyltransferase